MKKIVILLAVLLLPIFSFGLKKSIPKGFIYAGFYPQTRNIKSFLKKTISSQKYQQFVGGISMMSQQGLGFNALGDVLGALSLKKNEFIEVYAQVPSKTLIIRLHPTSNRAFMSKLKRTLKRTWRNVKQTKQGSQGTIYTTNPRYRFEKIYYYKDSDGTLLLSPKRRGIRAWRKSPKETIEANLFSQAESNIANEHPMIFFYFPNNVLMQLTRTFYPFKAFRRSFFMSLGANGEKASFDIMLPNLEQIPNIQVPGFIKNNPLMLFNTYLDAKKLSRVFKRAPSMQLRAMAQSMNLKNILGKRFFIAIHDFNYLELMQGMTSNIDAIIGIELKNSAPFKTVLDMAMQQAKMQRYQRQPKGKFSQSNYQGYPVYSFEEIPTPKGKMNLYIALLKDYLIVSLNRQSLNSSISNYVQGKRRVRLPVDGDNLVFFLNFQKVFDKMPMILPMATQYGVALENLKYLTGRYFIMPDDIIKGSFRLIFQ